MIFGHSPPAFNRNRFLQVFASVFLLSGLLSGCGLFGDNADEENSGQSAEKGELQAVDDKELIKPVSDQIGTPMAERVATLGFLNKRNGHTRDLELKPGQSVRIGRAIVRLRACERTAPWELHPEQGAFVQLLVNDRPATRKGKDQWKKVFSGWLFRESPSLNVVEHPIYDVWVKRCAMSFPGEEPAPEGSVNPTEPRSSASNFANSTSSAENDGAADSADSVEDDKPEVVEPVSTTPPVSSPPVRPVPEKAPQSVPDAANPSGDSLDDLIGDLRAETAPKKSGE